MHNELLDSSVPNFKIKHSVGLNVDCKTFVVCWKIETAVSLNLCGLQFYTLLTNFHGKTRLRIG